MTIKYDNESLVVFSSLIFISYRPQQKENLSASFKFVLSMASRLNFSRKESGLSDSGSSSWMPLVSLDNHFFASCVKKYTESKGEQRVKPKSQRHETNGQERTVEHYIREMIKTSKVESHLFPWKERLDFLKYFLCHSFQYTFSTSSFFFVQQKQYGNNCNSKWILS